MSAVHQMVTVESPLLLLDEFELPGVAPAPAGTAELILTFELARRDAGKSLLTVSSSPRAPPVGGSAAEMREMREQDSRSDHRRSHTARLLHGRGVVYEMYSV